jgi:hypothetical protein
VSYKCGPDLSDKNQLKTSQRHIKEKYKKCFLKGLPFFFFPLFFLAFFPFLFFFKHQSLSPP